MAVSTTATAGCAPCVTTKQLLVRAGFGIEASELSPVSGAHRPTSAQSSLLILATTLLSVSLCYRPTLALVRKLAWGPHLAAEAAPTVGVGGRLKAQVHEHTGQMALSRPLPLHLGHAEIT